MATTGGVTVGTATVIAKAEDVVWQSDQTPTAGRFNTVRNRDAFWRYTPLTNGFLVFTNEASDNDDTVLHLYSGPVDATDVSQLQHLNSADDNAANSHERISWGVTAGVTYYLISSAYNNSSDVAYYVLTVEQGPASESGAGAVNGGLLSVTVTMFGALNSQTGPVTPPAYHLAGELAASLGAQGTLHYDGPVAPGVYHLAGELTASLSTQATLHYDGPAIATWTVDLSAPEADATIVSSTPRFMVGVDLSTDEDVNYVVEVQYDDNPGFTSPTTVDAEANTGDGGAVLSPDAPLSGTIHWRARVLVDEQPVSDWTTAQKFTISAVTAATTLAVTWTVDASKKPPIHLWHFYPAGPSVGDTVTIYGQGFPTSALGYIQYGGFDITATSWTKVAAQPGGVIEGGNVNPEHWEIVFTAPNHYPGTGAVLTVTDEQRLSTS